MIVLALLFSFNSYSKVLLDEILITEKNKFSFKTVCEKMVSFETPLIEVASGTELDCMSKKVKVGEFCDKELAQDPYYLRAVIDAKSKEVICISGKRVLFKYKCGELCLSTAKASCEVIKDKLAKRLDIVQAAFVKNKQLDCFFESLPLKERTFSP